MLLYCNCCGATKDETEFRKWARSPTGHKNICKTCAKEKDKEYYRKNRETILEKWAPYRREYKITHRDSILKQRKEYRQKNKEKLRLEGIKRTVKRREQMIITTKELPKYCEYCNSELIWDSGSKNLICNNPVCPNNKLQKIKAWCLNVAPIDGLGFKTIEKILDDYFPSVECVEDLYTLIPLRTNNTTGEKALFNKMLEKLKQPISYSQFFLGLNIPGLGKKGAQAFEKCEDANELFHWMLDGSYYDKNTIIEENNFIKLFNIFQDANVVLSMLFDYNFYLNSCEKLVTIVNNTSNDNKGKVAITGSLSMKRSDFEKLLNDAGWTLDNKITKDTKYLITNTPDSGTSKNREADKLGVKKVTEAEFLTVI